MRPSSLSIYIVSMRDWIWSYWVCNFLMACERAACSLWSEVSTASPSHSMIGLRNDHLSQDVGELAGEDFLARVRLPCAQRPRSVLGAGRLGVGLFDAIPTASD